MSPSISSSGSLSSSILERLRAHDHAAWTRLTHLYTPVVYATCRWSGLVPADAADVTQDVFAAVSRSIESFRRDVSGGTFHGWLTAITRNKIRDHFRRCASQPLARGGSDAQAMMNNLTGDEGDSDSQAVPVSERQVLLARATELVSAEFEDRTWQAFWLTTVKGVSPQDAAHELGVSVNAVYKARSRVLGRLRAELEGLV